jgi:hypothetical protein
LGSRFGLADAARVLAEWLNVSIWLLADKNSAGSEYKKNFHTYFHSPLRAGGSLV